MTNAPEPLRKVDISYHKITPFGEIGPKRVYTDKDYENGHITREDAALTQFIRCKFRRVTFVNLEQCIFEDCKFDRCYWDTGLKDVHLNDCHLLRQDFSSTKMVRVTFRDGKMVKSDFSHNTSFTSVDLRGVRGLESSWRFYDVQVDPRPSFVFQNELNGQIERLPLPWLSRKASWTKLRSFGKLPFFGVSYAGLVGVPTAMFLLSVFNEQAEQLKAWGDVANGRIAELVAHVRPIPIPSLNLLLLLSLVLLALASTIYALACPARIKEFSYERWVDEFRRPGIQYLPLGWLNPWSRGICALCYPLGALGAAFVLVCKVVSAAVYIAQHSPMPWMLK